MSQLGHGEHTIEEHNAGISDVKALFGIDDGVCKTLKSIKPSVSGFFNKAVEKLYKRIDQFPQLRAMFRGDSGQEKASRAQKSHWMTILDGTFDPQYMQQATRIGHVHARIGLDPRWYISSYSLIYDSIFQDIIAQEFEHWKDDDHQASGNVEQLLRSIKRKISALNKACMLDMELSLTAYFEENVKKDKDAFVEIAKSFDQIASGDLRTELKGDVVRRSPLLYKNFERLRQGLRDLVISIKKMAGNVEQSSTRVKEQARKIEGQNQKQSSAISQALAAINSLDQSMRAIADKECELEKQMKKCLSCVSSGNSNMSHIRQTMSDIREAWNSVSELTGVIRNIASQTNFLALNASVEAARAGDAGKGFAVVATAIRELSQKTTKTAESITKSTMANDHLITGGVKKIAATLDAFQQAGEEIEDVSGVSNEISQEILSKKKDFSAVAEQCSVLSQIAQDTKSSVEAGRKEAIELNQMVQTLNKRTQKFRS